MRIPKSASEQWPWPRWLSLVGIWLLLTLIFSSQLYWSGYVSPWSRAFVSEALYWLSWGMLLPAVFWMCARVQHRARLIYAAGLLFGALFTAGMQPVLSELLSAALRATGWCLLGCTAATAFANDFPMRAMRVAAVNLPVYAGVVLAWHAASYYRESRERALRARELESSLEQAQLQSLRSQLNPHFLFNVLHSIAELVNVNPKLAEEIILRLGDLLRKVLLSTNAPEVRLEEELEFIRGYLDIEQMRLGSRLAVQWEVSAETLGALVPNLVLQPLVENAIQHGVAPSVRPSTIGLRARRDGDILELQVRDDGPGIEADGAFRGQGIGLANTRARLERLYGDRHSLKLATAAGFIVTLRIPFLTP